MTHEHKQFIIGLIDFAWKNRAFDNPQTATMAEEVRKEVSKPEPLKLVE